jgi:large subunit ribosomal protein L21
MSYAVVASGGKQYVARPGETIEVDRLPLEKNAAVDFDQVLLIADDGDVQVGTPFVEGAKVTGKVAGQIKGPKIIVFKYKPKIRYRRKQGHRQQYTRVAIEEVVLPGATKKRGPSAEKTEKAPKAEKPAAPKAKKAAAPSKAASKSSPKKETGGEATKAATKPPAKKSSPKKPAPGKKDSSSKASGSTKKPASRSTKKKSE